MNDVYHEKPDWQKALEHHEELCDERYKGIQNQFQSLQNQIQSIQNQIQSLDNRFDSVEKLLRFTLGAIIVMPPILIVSLTLILRVMP